MSQKLRKKGNSEPLAKGQRVILTHAQKKEICTLLSQKPAPTQTAVAYQYGIKQNTVSDIWNKRDRWLAINDDEILSKRKRERKPLYPEIEEALTIWFTRAVHDNITVTIDLLKQKAKHFATLLGVEKFGASNGWFERYKSRYHIQSYVKSGEGNSAPLERMDQERAKLHEVLRESISMTFSIVTKLVCI
jgi:PDZ domain-containing secreted protein